MSAPTCSASPTTILGQASVTESSITLPPETGVAMPGTPELLKCSKCSTPMVWSVPTSEGLIIGLSIVRNAGTRKFGSSRSYRPQLGQYRSSRRATAWHGARQGVVRREITASKTAGITARIASNKAQAGCGRPGRRPLSMRDWPLVSFAAVPFHHCVSSCSYGFRVGNPGSCPHVREARARSVFLPGGSHGRTPNSKAYADAQIRENSSRKPRSAMHGAQSFGCRRVS